VTDGLGEGIAVAPAQPALAQVHLQQTGPLLQQRLHPEELSIRRPEEFSTGDRQERESYLHFKTKCEIWAMELHPVELVFFSTKETKFGLCHIWKKM